MSSKLPKFYYTTINTKMSKTAPLKLRYALFYFPESKLSFTVFCLSFLCLPPAASLRLCLQCVLVDEVQKKFKLSLYKLHLLVM